MSAAQQGRDVRTLVPWAMAGAIVAISFAAITFRKAQPTHPLVSSAIRLGLAAILLLPIAWVRRPPSRLDRRTLSVGALAAVCYAVHFAAWVSSLGLTSVAASVTLVTVTPLLLGLWSLVSGQDRPTPRIWGALALAATGVTILGGTDLLASQDALLGDALALLGAGAMAIYLHRARTLGEDLDVPWVQALATAGAAAILALAAWLLDVPLRPAEPRHWWWLLLSALVPQLVGHGLLTWTLRHRGPAAVGMVTVGEPAGATILAVLLLGERVAGPALLGCAITVAAVAVALTAREAPQKR